MFIELGVQFSAVDSVTPLLKPDPYGSTTYHC